MKVSRGGRPGLTVLNSPYCPCAGRNSEATFEEEDARLITENSAAGAVP